MLSRLKLGAKLLLSFSGVAVITLILGAVGYYGAIRSAKAVQDLGAVRLPAVESLFHLMAEAESLRGSMRTLAIPGLAREVRQRQYRNIGDSREDYEKAWQTFEALPRTPQEAELWQQLVPVWNAWRQENNKALEMAQKIDRLGLADPLALEALVQGFTKDHYQLVSRVLQLLLQKDAVFSGGEDHTACNAGKWLPTFKSDNPELTREVQAIVEPHRRFHESVKTIKRLVQAGDPGQARATFERDMLPAMTEVFQHFEAMLKISGEARAEFGRLREQILGPVLQKQRAAKDLLEKLVKLNSDTAAASVKKAVGESTFLKMATLVAMVLAVVLALALGFLITRSLTRTISRIVSSLSDGSSQVSAAASQVSAASQSLAQGASEQAASLEETSSSLEEMASMTRSNAENARQADQLMEETAKVVEQADRSMKGLVTAMEEVSQASQDTAKIIKTIDEIAFQTNLLALNAAVEAARAGEAGAGFAVVADEVRALAMRAAEAAKTTANLIETTLSKVNEGSELVSKTAEAFAQVAGSSEKVKELVAEIAAASREQAEGVDQVNKAVAEMNKVTQQVAANAEESAGAAEELNAQSEAMKGVVAELVALVGQTTQSHNGYGLGEGSKKKVLNRLASVLSGIPGSSLEPKPAAGTFLPPQTQPQQLLPMAKDYQDF